MASPLSPINKLAKKIFQKVFVIETIQIILIGFQKFYRCTSLSRAMLNFSDNFKFEQFHINELLQNSADGK